MLSHRISVAFLLFPLTMMALTGCSRPQPTSDQVAGATAPADLQIGPTPPGGPSEAPTGAGAGGSAAAGYENGRVGSTDEHPTLPPQPAGITYSRMSPTGSSGSGSGDRGNPIPPEVSLAAPPDPGTGTAHAAVPVSNPTAAAQPAASQAAAIKPVVIKPTPAKPPTTR